ncbi:MAG: hypothetical protein ACHP7P_03795 [Terriglobales bacterium]
MATTLIRVQTAGQVPWNCYPAAGGNWVGVCEPFKLTLQAETWANLMEDIGLALNALMLDLVESKELEPFLREHGWKLSARVPNHIEDVRFDVPFSPVMAAHGSQRSVHQ